MIRAISHTVFTIGATAMLLAAVAAASESTIELQRNPFDRPATEALRSSTAPVELRSLSVGDPFLRAVLAAGSRSAVNFGGVILQKGESANGYRLLSVEEGSATFIKDGKKVDFSLHEPEQADE